MTIKIPHRLPLSLLLLAMAAALLWGAPPAIGALPPSGQGAAIGVKEPRPTRPSELAASDSSRLSDVGDAGESDGEEVVPVAVDPQMYFPLIEVSGAGIREVEDGGEAADADSRLIYSNTLGIYGISFPANLPVSDDIGSTAPDGCNLKSFKFKVLGKVNPTGASGPYTVKYALYSNCPWAMGSGSTGTQMRELIKIPGTTGEIVFPDDGPRSIKHVVDPHMQVPIPANVYLGLRFDRANCGTVVGAPAMVGFSGDGWDFPGFPCYGHLGGFPLLPHASFWLEMYGDANCPRSFPGYKNAQASGPTAILGANVQGVDDIRLQVPDCQMVGYEVVVRGVGFYSFDLRRRCDGEVIPETERTYQVNVNSTPQIQVAKFSFDPPVPLPDDDLFLGFRSSSNSSGAVIAGKVYPSIGESTGDYFKVGLEGCSPVIPAQGVHGAINLAITCAGELPTGACCDMAVLECAGTPESTRCEDNDDCPPGTTCEAVCRELSEMNCPWPVPGYGSKPAWVEGGVCKSDPFELPCGVAACCLPNDTCENLTENDCLSRVPSGEPTLWQRGAYCAEGGQYCPFYACLRREGDCSLIHDGVGCSNPTCCSVVCAFDPWCCHVEWDRGCVELAGEECVSAPYNDSCGHSPGQGPIELVHGTPVFGSNLAATEGDVFDQGFCCNGSDPGAFGAGSVWFKFVATHESAQLDTCASAVERDTLVNVYSLSDPTNPGNVCQTLSLLGCGDNDGCPVTQEYGPESKHSRFCVSDLTIGHTYSVMLASKIGSEKGTYQIELKMPCQGMTPFPSGDCNENGALDGCDLSDRSSADCNGNLVPDECDIAAGVEADCNSNATPDRCDIESGVAPDCQPNGVPDECELGAGSDCDKDFVPDVCDPFRASLMAEPPNWTFGRTIRSNGSEFYVADGSVTAAGEVHVHRHEQNEWIKKQTIVPSASSPGDYFGIVMAASNEWMFALATHTQELNATVAGTVFIFRRDEGEWREVGRLPDPAEVSESTGWCNLSVDGNVLLASLCFRCNQICDPQSKPKPAIHYIYELQNDVWHKQTRIESQYDANGRYRFLGDAGKDVVVIGWQESDSDSYVADAFVRVFRKAGSGWVEEPKLVLPHPIGSQSYGQSIQLRNNVLLATTRSGSGGGYGTVSAYIYRRDRSRWDLESTLSFPELEVGADDNVAAILRDDTIAFAYFSSDLWKVRSQVFSRRPDGVWVQGASFELAHGPTSGRGVVGLAGNADYLGISVADWYGDDVLGLVNMFAMPVLDCNSNDISDGCEWIIDCNGRTGVSECVWKQTGDSDANGGVDLRDLAGLQRCFTGSGGGLAACCGIFDSGDTDGDADLVDFVAFQREMTGP